METNQWNQTWFPCRARIVFQAKAVSYYPPEEDRQYYQLSTEEILSALTKHLQEQPKWRYTHESSPNPTIQTKLRIVGDAEVDVRSGMIAYALYFEHYGKIKPGMIRAFSAYVDALAEVLAKSQLTNVHMIVAEAQFIARGWHFATN